MLTKCLSLQALSYTLQIRANSTKQWKDHWLPHPVPSFLALQHWAWCLPLWASSIKWKWSFHITGLWEGFNNLCRMPATDSVLSKCFVSLFTPSCSMVTACVLKATSKAHKPGVPKIYHSNLQVTGMWTVLARLFLPTNLTTTMWNFISAPFRILYFAYKQQMRKSML